MTDGDPHDDWLESALSFVVSRGIDPNLPADTTIAPILDEDSAIVCESEYSLPVVTVELEAPTEVDPADQVTPDLRLLRRLGRGGMAVVDSAWQRSLEREVAVKRLREDQLDEWGSAGLLAEARITGMLEHPNVIPVHSLGVGDDGYPLMVMKQVEGVTWHKLIIRPDHPAWTAWPGDRLARHVEFLTRVCRAVEYAHARQIGHLDIKPGNVMIGSFGEVYLMDWGLAVRFDRLDELPQQELVGTPGFMAPEMLQGRRGTDPRTDVYLLGSTLHFALTSYPRHDGEGLAGKLRLALTSAPARYDVGIPTELGSIVNKACACARRDRFGSVRELREALEGFAAHRGSMRITRAAQRQLDQLKRLLELARDGDIDAVGLERLQALVTEARFGFGQALHDWPENRRAEQGLQRALELAIEFELRRENLQAATALLRSLKTERPKLAMQVEELAERMRERGDASARLEELERENMLRGTDLRRSISFAVTGLVCCAVALIWGQASRAGLVRGTQVEALVVGLMGTAAIGLYVKRARHLVLNNQIRRRFTLAFAVFVLGFDLNRIVGILADIPLEQGILVDHGMLIAFVGTGAALVYIELFWALAVAVVGLVATALYPLWFLEIGGVELILVNGVFAWVTRPRSGGRNGAQRRSRS